MIPILQQEKLYTKVHLIQTTHQKGRRRRHSHFKTAKFGGKLSIAILILIHARAKTFDLSTDLHPHWIRGPGGGSFNFTTVHKLQDISDHYTWLTTSFAFAGNGFSIGKRSRRLAAPWPLWGGYLSCMHAFILCDFDSFTNPI